MTHHLAQINIATLKEPIDSPLLADFVAKLDEVNKLADGAPGFVWRLQSEQGNATAIQAYDDPMTIVNLSVWESPKLLRNFVYGGGHLEVMRQRRKWFQKMEVYLALWWVPAGHIPTVAEAKARLAYLAQHGESAQAFTMRQIFPSPSSESSSIIAFGDSCPA
jgi:hypothetical protein